MAIYEVDPSEYEDRSAFSDRSGGDIPRASEPACPDLPQEQENAERMEVLRMGIEEGLANGSAEPGLFERLRAYFDEAAAKKTDHLRPHPSR